jgi:hypothetical protein
MRNGKKKKEGRIGTVIEKYQRFFDLKKKAVSVFPEVEDAIG